MERNPLPQTKCCWLQTMQPPLSWKSFPQGRQWLWKLCWLLGNSLVTGNTVCGVCISYCSSVIKYLPQITEGRVYPVPILRVQSIKAGKECWQDWVGQLVAWYPPSGSRKRGTLVLLAIFFFFLIWSGIWPLEWCHPHLGLGFSLQLNLSGDTVRHIHECVFMAILKPVKLKLKSNHHRVVLDSGTCWRTTFYIVKTHPTASTHMFSQGLSHTKTHHLCLHDIN